MPSSSLHKSSGHGQTPWMGVVIMVIASTVIGYVLMTLLILRNETINLTKIYGAVLMGLWMGVVELVMFMVMGKALTNVLYLLVLIAMFVGIGVLSWLIREQKGVDQRQFMLQMIEHHEMAIAMASKVKDKPQDPALTPIVNNILTSQQKEINEMRSILSRLDTRTNTR